MRARHRLSKLLLRRETVYPGPGGTWTRAHLAWLTRLTFDDVANRLTAADYLAAVQALTQRRDTLDAAISQLVPDSPHAATIPALRCFRGRAVRRGGRQELLAVRWRQKVWSW
jgi:transposase